MPASALAENPRTDIQGIEPLVTLPEFAAIYRKSPATIRRSLQLGTCRPLPFEKYPYRWRKSDIEKDLATRRTDVRMRKHGFAATRLKTAKAKKG